MKTKQNKSFAELLEVLKSTNVGTTKEYIDLTMDLSIACERFNQESRNAITNPELLGHVGTHVDIMDTTGLSPDRFISRAHLINVCDIFDREITLDDTNLNSLDILPGDSVLFRTNWAKQKFTTKDYFINHPYLAYAVIDFLLDRKVNLICLDAPGVRRDIEHKEIDIYCAKHNVFILENLINLDQFVSNKVFMLYCFPIKFAKNTGVTCRVIARQY